MGADASDVNLRFIREHIAHRHLEFNPLPRWPGHRGALKGAARRAGLTVSEHDNTLMFSDGGRCVGASVGLVGSLIGHAATRMTRSKAMTRTLLESAGLPIPRGAVFDADAAVRARRRLEAEQAQHPGRRFVIKPSDGSGGRGITTGITNGTEVAGAWKRAVAASTEGKILLEEHVHGVDVRVFVVGDRATAAAARLPAHVIGDGRRRVDELVAELTDARKVNAYLAAREPQVDQRHLARTGRETTTVPDSGEVVLLNGTGNLSQGGVSVDVSDLLAPQLLETAVHAAASIPGLGMAGVDLLVPDLSTPEGAHVLELNPSANLSINQFPSYGQSRDVAAEIIEEMLRTRSA